MYKDLFELSQHINEELPTEKWFSELTDLWVEEDIKNRDTCACSVTPWPPCSWCTGSNERFHEWLTDHYTQIPSERLVELTLKGYWK